MNPLDLIWIYKCLSNLIPSLVRRAGLIFPTDSVPFRSRNMAVSTDFQAQRPLTWCVRVQIKKRRVTGPLLASARFLPFFTTSLSLFLSPLLSLPIFLPPCFVDYARSITDALQNATVAALIRYMIRVFFFL